jgi:aldose 1-epimerase
MSLPSISEVPFGNAHGTEVSLFVLENRQGSLLKVTNFGATVTELHVPDRTGKLADVVLGFDDVAGYAKGCPFFGATIGRVANRIGDSKFTLDGKVHQLAANDPPHHLHGGPLGWDKVVWSVDRERTTTHCLALTYVSADGEEGYPGSVTARVDYRLTDDNALDVTMSATCSAPTLVNLAHHSYWNLAGHAAGQSALDSVLDHELVLQADEYTPGTPVVPDGRVVPVRGTPFDFTRSKRLGADIERVGPVPNGYDHNFVVRGEPNSFRAVAELYEPKSGRKLVLSANQPGVQLYSGNFLDGTRGKGGVAYTQRTGVCLETQGFPNAVNVPAWAGQVVLRPGQQYEHRMLHQFSAV